MDLFQIAIALGILAFFAHIVKGLTGFGPAIVFVSVGSLIHDPVEVIILAALLDIIGGGYLSVLNPHFFGNREYWVPVGVLMIIGAIIGGLALFIVPASTFEILLGVAIILISVWFLVGNSEPEGESDDTENIGLADGVVGTFSGFCGGFTGMGGPPLIAYLGAKFEKSLFRAVIVPIFLLAAIARFSTYVSLGMVDVDTAWMYVLPSIGVILGNHVGNHFFDHVEQKWFTILIGIILFFSGLRLII